MNSKPQFEIAYLLWPGYIVYYGDGKIQTDYDFFYSECDLATALFKWLKQTNFDKPAT